MKLLALIAAAILIGQGVAMAQTRPALPVTNSPMAQQSWPGGPTTVPTAVYPDNQQAYPYGTVDNGYYDQANPNDAYPYDTYPYNDLYQGPYYDYPYGTYAAPLWFGPAFFGPGAHRIHPRIGPRPIRPGGPAFRVGGGRPGFGGHPGAVQLRGGFHPGGGFRGGFHGGGFHGGGGGHGGGHR